jgi:putative toxin-antitoxin system antitoxin component (TIGR02293 family)
MPTIKRSGHHALAATHEQPLSTAVYRWVSRLLDIGEVASEGDLADVVDRRLPTRSIKSLVKGGLEERIIHSLVIPRRTLEHRTERHESLSHDESDKMVRIARVVALARTVFGDNEKALAWLRDDEQFDGRSPLAKSATAAGTRQVEERLFQVYYGLFG